MIRILSMFSIFVISGCSLGLPTNSGEHTAALAPATEGRLAEAVTAMMAENPNLTGVVPLMHGADAFAARMLLADVATTSIDIQ